MKYIIKKDVASDGYYVQQVNPKRIVFFGTETECEEWIKRA